MSAVRQDGSRRRLNTKTPCEGSEENHVSMYSMITGGPNEVVATVVIGLIGLDDAQRDSIPRWRDCYLRQDDGELILGIVTRTGGPNREAFGAENAAMEAFPGFLGTADVEIDATYATWEYSAPAQDKAGIRSITEAVPDFHRCGLGLHPNERLRLGLEAARRGELTHEAAIVIPAVLKAIKGDPGDLEALGKKVRKGPIVDKNGVGPDITTIEV
jgi:hypothetical protein